MYLNFYNNTSRYHLNRGLLLTLFNFVSSYYFLFIHIIILFLIYFHKFETLAQFYFCYLLKINSKLI